MFIVAVVSWLLEPSLVHLIVKTESSPGNGRVTSWNCDASGTKARSDDLIVGRLIEELLRARVKSHCPDRQKVLLLNGANWTWVQVVRPCAKPAELDVCWPVSFVIYDASTKILVVEAHISPEVL